MHPPESIVPPIVSTEHSDAHGAVPTSTNGLQVLAVEDNALNLMILRQQLGKLGCHTSTASNGQEALDQLGRRSFDIVLMDCLMPVMDGFEAARLWRRVESDGLRERTPIVAVTALVMQSDIDLCLASGMDEVLSKPLHLATLEDALLRWTRKRR